MTDSRVYHSEQGVRAAYAVVSISSTSLVLHRGASAGFNGGGMKEGVGLVTGVGWDAGVGCIDAGAEAESGWGVGMV